MSLIAWLLVAAGAAVLVWGLFVGALFVAGRREWAVAVARLVPDCVVLMQRLLRDERVPRRRKALLVAVIAYLALPFDLVPDFIPVVGQLDDALIVGLALRHVLRGAGEGLVGEHWPGPPEGLELVTRLARTAPGRRPHLSLRTHAPSHVATVTNSERLGDEDRRTEHERHRERAADQSR